MAGTAPNVFTIAPDRPFLETLARAVLDGFPSGGGPPTPAALPTWTILLPTRRAARELEATFYRIAGQKSLLLPRIRPIGDIDEGLLPGDGEADESWRPGISPAIPKAAELLLLIGLVQQWAARNPQIQLAAEVAAAPQSAHALALSLLELLEALEIDEVDVTRIGELYDLEIARHREAILDLLSLVRTALPARLHAAKLLNPVARRSLVLRAEALRLTELNPQSPFIAAGSTGSIPAARELLKAIADLPSGAVVLPGLDMTMDQPSWQAVGAQHPQHMLKSLVAFLGIERNEVRPLGEVGGARAWLASEIMRPPDTSEDWHDVVTGSGEKIAHAMRGIELIEAANVHEEAAIIALMLRKSLDVPGQKSCLITPDRELARRVKAELRRWAIDIDDSAGEPLSRTPGGSLLVLLLSAIAAKFSAATLLPLLHHGYCRCGRPADDAHRLASVIELALFRTGLTPVELGRMAELLRERWNSGDDHRHPAISRITAENWSGAIDHAAFFESALAKLRIESEGGFKDRLNALTAACEALAGETFYEGETGEMLKSLVEELQEGGSCLDNCNMALASAILLHRLQSTPVRPPMRGDGRIAILGLLEARLIAPDIAILGGLNEGSWPGLPDAGPWLNRPMRDTLAMPQPERQIGQMAHDFVQAFCCKQAKLVWAKRMGNEPAIPSRFVLRLKMLLESAKFSGSPEADWASLARALREADHIQPMAKPKPTPPLAARPRKLSVTRIEQLVRDPYAIYGRHVLGLEPLDDAGVASDYALKGIIFHAVIARFLERYGEAIPADIAHEIVKYAEEQFSLFRSMPAAFSFWWPRIRRIAAWFAENERRERALISRAFAEVPGRIEIPIAGREVFTLTCRADRIDLMKDGTIAITDYKTGSVPSQNTVDAGLAPQLGLEAAIAMRAGFKAIGPCSVTALKYVKLGGGKPAAKATDASKDHTPEGLAAFYLEKLERLVSAYLNETQAYFPRVIAEKEDEELDYDHLSRFREWSLSGADR